MNSELIEEVLSCPSLPSLPATALRVIELTADPNVSLERLADTIQNDQGLAVKVLRTVNSSFYGLRTRCSTINKAMVMLGLSPVKSLALGFSLVSALADEQQSGFDFVTYWRRGLYSAVGARCLAESTQMRCREEAFLACLLQDVGQVAMHRALGPRYAELLRSAGADHRRLAEIELAELDVQHPDVGAMLAQRWKLPDELVLPIKYHERPTAAPGGCLRLAQAVAMGNMAHDVLTNEDPAEPLRRFYAKGHEWFALTAAQLAELLRKIADQVRPLPALFRVDVGPWKDPEEVIRRADARLLELAEAAADETAPGRAQEALVVSNDHVDPLTGALTRMEFDATVRRAFQLSRSTGEGMSILNVAVEGVRALVAARCGVNGEEVLVGTTALLKKHFEPMGGAVCRVGSEVFGVVFLGATARAVLRCVEEFRTDLARVAEAWSRAAHPHADRVTASMGLASLEPNAAVMPASPAELVVSAARAVQEARAAGRGEIRVAPRTAA